MNALPHTKKRRTFLDFFPVPDFLLMATAGVAISDESVRLVSLRKDAGGDFELEHASEALLTKGAVEAGFVNDAEAVKKALSEFRSRLGVEYVRATLPEEKAYLFTASVDEAAGGDLTDSVAFIIEENAPLTLPEAVFSYEVVGHGERRGQLKVAVTALPKSVVDAQAEILESAGLVPVAFDLESQAIARAVVPEGEDGSVLVVNLGERKTGLYVVERGVVQFSLTPSYGVGSSGPGQSTSDLRSEVRKLFAFWNTKLDQGGSEVRKISKIIVAGQGAANKNFVEDLLSGVEVAHSSANVWTNLFDPGDKMPDLSFEDSLGYATAIGLALAPRTNKYA